MARDWKEYERTIAKALGAWFECVFRRTPGSGAWGKQGQSRYSTGHDATGDFHGDIVAPPEALFPFSVECKCYKTVNLYLALYGKSEIFDWWLQCALDARAHHKAPMLVFKENSRNPLVAISDKTFQQLARVKKLKTIRRMSLTYDTKFGPRTFHIFHFSQFLEAVPCKYIKMFVR